MFSDVPELRSALLSIEPKSFVSHHIFERVPHAFGRERQPWIEWKHRLAELIDVDPQDVVMVGSAAVGFSLNPKKSFKQFDADSDFDCGVVSGHYFDLSWRYLRKLRVTWLDLPAKERRAVKIHRKNYVFAGTIAADSILALLPFGQQWQNALDMMAQIEPTKGRHVKMRIYKDFDSLRHYQAFGIERLREQIATETHDPDEVQDIESITNEDDHEPRR